MEDLNELKFSLTLNEYHSFHLSLESKMSFVFQLFYDSFNGDESMNNQSLNRLITVSSELMMIDDPLVVDNVADEKERLELKQRLTNERNVLRQSLEQLRDIGTKNKVSNFDTFDTRTGALKTIFGIKDEEQK